MLLQVLFAEKISQGRLLFKVAATILSVFVANYVGGADGIIIAPAVLAGSCAVGFTAALRFWVSIGHETLTAACQPLR